MRRIIYFLAFFSVINMSDLQAQSVRGQVVDNLEQPIDGVSVIMQTLDSVFVDAAITDTLGIFTIHQTMDQTYRFIFQHLLYETEILEMNTPDAGIIHLLEKDIQLSEIVVKGERPQVKVDGGKLIYDIPQQTKDRTSTNAFEVVRELPGLAEKDESLELIGASQLNVVLNGQLTTLTLDQMLDLLRSIPASRVVKAEIMYNAPAKYNVKGALLNVILSQETASAPNLQGEVGVGFRQRHRAWEDAHANILYSNKGFSMDLLVEGETGKTKSGEDMLARHTLDGSVTEISQENQGLSDIWQGTARLGMNYSFANNDKLSFSYYLNAGDDETERTAIADYLYEATEETSQSESSSESDTRSTLHNIRLQYDGHQGLTAGMDFTRYHSPATLNYWDESTEGSYTDLINDTQQDISRWSVFLNHTSQIASRWQLNYGAQGTFSCSDNYADYLYNTGNGYLRDEDSFMDDTQKEYTANAFAEISGSFNDHFQAMIGLKGEYFKSDYESDGVSTNLWNQWTIFPSASLSYVFSPRHILKLDVSSNKTYPSYWQLTPQVTPLNSYTEEQGNPTLKPYRTYNGQLTYVFRQKYMLVAFLTYKPDYFTQIPYQSDSELKQIFRYENMDHQLIYGLGAIIPLKIGKFWGSQITIRGGRTQEKDDDFYGMSYDRSAWVGMIRMNNTFSLCDKPHLRLTLDGQYITPGTIQGLYDLGYVYEISAGLKWTFANDRAILTLKGEDLFASSDPHTIKINQGNQWSDLSQLNDKRSLTLSFVWKFGGYKEQKHEAVDTSRFGK